jgi:hypothetical protein
MPAIEAEISVSEFAFAQGKPMTLRTCADLCRANGAAAIPQMDKRGICFHLR